MFSFGIIIILVVLIALGLSIWAIVKKDNFGGSNNLNILLDPLGGLVDESTLENTKSVLLSDDGYSDNFKLDNCIPNKLTPPQPKDNKYKYAITTEPKYKGRIYGIYVDPYGYNFYSSLTCDELSNL